MKILKKEISLLLTIILFVGIIYTPVALSEDVDYDNLLMKEMEKAIVDKEKIINLINKGANPNVIDDNNISALEQLSGQTIPALYDFISEDDLVVILKHFKKNGLKLQRADDNILYSPISTGSKRFVKELLELGADPTKRIYGELPIDIAEKNGHSEISELLIEYGAKKGDPSEIAQIQLVQAASDFNIENIKRAIEKGALITREDKYGKYALIEALQGLGDMKEQFETIKYLLNNGADPNHLVESGFKSVGKVPSLYMAVFPTLVLNSDEKDLADSYKNSHKYARQILNILIDSGAYVSGRTEYNQTPLHFAAKSNNFEMAKFLIENNAKIMPEDSSGKTPLDYAESGEMIKLLKENGAIE